VSTFLLLLVFLLLQEKTFVVDIMVVWFLALNFGISSIALIKQNYSNTKIDDENFINFAFTLKDYVNIYCSVAAMDTLASLLCDVEGCDVGLMWKIVLQEQWLAVFWFHWIDIIESL